MNKFVDFYNKVIADESSQKELSSILSGKTLNDASDEQLEKVGQIAKRLGFDITTSEAREFLNSGDKKLSSEDLDAVAGGKPQGDGHVVIKNPRSNIDTGN